MGKTIRTLLLRALPATIAGGLLDALCITPATATEVHHTKYCVGTEVRRCVWLDHDSTANRMRALAWTGDTAGGRNFDVAASRVQLQYWTGSAWRYVSSSLVYDYDGWHATSDGAAGRVVACRNGQRYKLRAVALFQWRGAAASSGWVAGPGQSFTC